MPPVQRSSRSRRKVAGHILKWEEPAAKGRNGHLVNWADIAEEIKSGEGKWALVKTDKTSNSLSASRRAILDGRYSGFKEGGDMWEVVVCKRMQGGFGLYVRWKGNDKPDETVAVDFEEPPKDQV